MNGRCVYPLLRPLWFAEIPSRPLMETDLVPLPLLCTESVRWRDDEMELRLVLLSDLGRFVPVFAALPLR